MRTKVRLIIGVDINHNLFLIDAAPVCDDTSGAREKLRWALDCSDLESNIEGEITGEQLIPGIHKATAMLYFTDNEDDGPDFSLYEIVTEQISVVWEKF